MRTAEAEVRVTKRSWRGQYERLVRLSDAFLHTLDPVGRRETGRFAFTEVCSVQQRGSELVVEVMPSCGTCGLFRRQLCLAARSPDAAGALSAAVRARLTRSLSAADTDAARELSAESALLSAIPRDMLGPGGAPHAGFHGLGPHGLGAPSPGVASSERAADAEVYIFDVEVAVLKARGLPRPPPLCG